MDKDNQTLRELIRARKQARPNKQNADSSDTDSYENMAEFENLANADSQAKFENFANGDDRAEIDNFSNTDNKTKFDNENLANSDTNTQNFNNQKITNFNNQNLDKNPANSDNPNKNHKISRNYDENPIIIKDYGIAVNYFSIVFTVILGVIGVIFGKMEFRKLSFLIILYLPILKFVFNGYFERKNSHYYFENSKIIHAKNKFNPIQELNLGDIVDFKKTTFYISPYDTEKIKVKKKS